MQAVLSAAGAAFEYSERAGVCVAGGLSEVVNCDGGLRVGCKARDGGSNNM